jgi:hypothetical protein
MIGGFSVISCTAAGIVFGKSGVSWASVIGTPSIGHAALSTAGASGQVTTVYAQNVTAADALVGGKFITKGGDSSGAAGTGGDNDVQAGNGATKGKVNLRDGGGVARLTVAANGDLEAGSPFLPKSLTAAQRDALAARVPMVIWNSDTAKLQVCTVAGTPGTWVDLH